MNLKHQPEQNPSERRKMRKKRFCQAKVVVREDDDGYPLVVVRCKLITDPEHDFCPLHELENGPVDHQQERSASVSKSSES